MRKSREESVKELLPAFLQGRSQHFIDKFNARDFDRQYQSIMQWKRRASLEAKPAAAAELMKILKKVIKTLDNGVEMTSSENQKIGKLLNGVREKLSNQQAIIRQREIEALERQYSAIARQIASLKGEDSAAE